MRKIAKRTTSRVFANRLFEYLDSVVSYPAKAGVVSGRHAHMLSSQQFNHWISARLLTSFEQKSLPFIRKEAFLQSFRLSKMAL